MDTGQFQAGKWNARLYQVALNFRISSFILEEKLRNNENLSLPGAKDIKEPVIFLLYRQITDEQLYEKIINRHLRRQIDLNNAYSRQNPNLSK